jgi:DNA-binding MarR family transcriptional regulator
MGSVDLSECAGCLCQASRRAALAITRAFEHELRPHNIRITQFTILTNLAARGPMTIGALASLLGIERTTMTRNLALLEKHGWIWHRADDDDSRARRVGIKPAGRRKAEAAFPAWRLAQARIAAKFGDDGVAALRTIAAEAVE